MAARFFSEVKLLLATNYPRNLWWHSDNMCSKSQVRLLPHGKVRPPGRGRFPSSWLSIPSQPISHISKWKGIKNILDNILENGTLSQLKKHTLKPNNRKLRTSSQIPKIAYPEAFCVSFGGSPRPRSLACACVAWPFVLRSCLCAPVWKCPTSCTAQSWARTTRRYFSHLGEWRMARRHDDAGLDPRAPTKSCGPLCDLLVRLSVNDDTPRMPLASVRLGVLLGTRHSRLAAHTSRAACAPPASASWGSFARRALLSLPHATQTSCFPEQQTRRGSHVPRPNTSLPQ